MNKIIALQKIALVKENRTTDYIQNALNEIETYTINEEFDYPKLMQFIHSKKSNKLGYKLCILIEHWNI